MESEGDQTWQQQQDYRPHLTEMDPSQGDMSVKSLGLLNDFSPPAASSLDLRSVSENLSCFNPAFCPIFLFLKLFAFSLFSLSNPLSFHRCELTSENLFVLKPSISISFECS